jgi:cytoskeletal protein RodZ
MDLASFGEELKRIRLEKQISLMDISFATRINIKFLEAIEAGKFSILPQTYVRAFLREYGETIGMGSEEILRRYDAILQPPPVPTQEEARTPVPTVPAPSPRTAEPKPQKVSMASKKNLLFSVVLLVAVALVLLLRSPSSKRPETTQEVPFDAVVKESEASTYKPDTLSAVLVPPPVVRQDSLRLEMTTTDSVWVSILVDGKNTLEFLFPPNRKRTFSAKDQFSITIGNAGGASFKLNGKELGTLGKRGAVLRNVLINEAGIKSL